MIWKNINSPLSYKSNLEDHTACSDNLNKKTKKQANVLIVILLLLLSVNFISGEIASLGRIAKGDCIQLVQTCTSCTTSAYSNITKIQFPDKTISYYQLSMEKHNMDYNYTYCNNDQLGEYIVTVCTDVDGNSTCPSYTYYTTETGDTPDDSQGYMVLAQLGMIALFTSLGFSFSREKWKVRTFFFMIALLMGVICLNSIRVIAGTSSKLSAMGNAGLILGIIVLGFMFLYILVFYSIEVFKYFKNKKEMRWQVNQV